MTQGQDLLTGSVPKKLIRFAFPLFLANLLQALYNVVDMLVVGKIVGKTGLAAISNASMLCFIINSLCIGLTMGGSVLVAQCKGANDQTGQRDTIGMLFFLSLVGSAVVTILGLAIYEALFQALNVPANAYQDACGYMKIICCGTVFVFGYNAVCSILKGLGDSQTPLFFVGVATVLNVVLDVLLVGPLSMGTAGAAWATITAQGVSFMASLVYLRRYQPGFSLRKIEFHREKLLAILKVGLPTAIQMVVVNTAYLLVTGMLNQFGTPVAAASGVGLKINTFAGMHCWAIGQAITAMVGQCLGAGQIERARKVVRSGLLLNLAVTAAVAVVVQLLAEPLICMFDGTSPEVIRVGVLYLRLCCGVNSLVYAAMYTLDSFAIGVGAAHVAMVNALLVAMEFNAMLPAAQTPRDTEGYEGFYHLTQMTGNVSQAELHYILRDHSAAGFQVRKETVLHAAKVLNERYGAGTVEWSIQDQYQNMAEIIQQHFQLIDHAKAAAEAVGLTPVVEPIRGGTDGAKLSFMGLPCPNLGTGGYAFHGPYEHITVEGMEKTVELLCQLVQK